MTAAKKKPAKNKKAAIKKKATPAPKRKRGNPSKYDPDMHPFMAWALAIRGKTNAEIAAALSVSRVTLFAWGKKHPEFLSILKSGKDVADAKVENALFQRAFGYEYEEVKTEDDCGDIKTTTTVKSVPGDVTAQIFWLCNRRKGDWKNVNKLEHSGPNGGPVPVSNVDLEKILGTEEYREYERKVFSAITAKPTNAGS